MWTIVHFPKDNAIEIVPDTWIRKKDKCCAWPIKKKLASRLIEKRSYPNDINYKWYPSRIVGQSLSKYSYFDFYIIYFLFHYSTTFFRYLQ